ncbi:hypothetical protein WQ59_19435 [Streptomyces sp. KE1]|nr:hypothetical protein WQ59_19435 [Streptomyces sp. KE1]
MFTIGDFARHGRVSVRMLRHYEGTAQPLTHWIDTHGYRTTGYPREISLECPENHDAWVTELQAPVTESSPAGA